MLLLIAAIGTTRMACYEGRQAFTPPRGPFSLHPLVTLVLGFRVRASRWTFKGLVQMARKQQAEQWAPHRQARDERR